MVGDSLPEVQGLLAAIYEPFYTTKPVKADTIVEGDCPTTHGNTLSGGRPSALPTSMA